jgi:hypothetical protein
MMIPFGHRNSGQGEERCLKTIDGRRRRACGVGEKEKSSLLVFMASPSPFYVATRPSIVVFFLKVFVVIFPFTIISVLFSCD